MTRHQPVAFDRDAIVKAYSLIEPLFTSLPFDLPAFTPVLTPLDDSILLHEQFDRMTHLGITYTIFSGEANKIRYVSMLAPSAPTIASPDDSGFFASDSETVWITGQKHAKQFRHINTSGLLARYRVAMYGLP